MSLVILSFSILIIFHEFGHFILAKIFKINVDKLSLFFNPGFSILKKKLGETVYEIGWIPLGGYIKFSGKIDEKRELNSKFACKRLLILLGGVAINVLLSIIIFSFLLFYNGETCLPIKYKKDGFMVNVRGIKKLYNGFFIRTDEEIEYIDIDKGQKKGRNTNTYFYTRLIVDKVLKQSVAEKAGVRKRDKIIGIDNKNKLIILYIKRNGSSYKKILPFPLNIGLRFRYKKSILETTRYNVGKSFFYGLKKTIESITIQLLKYRQGCNLITKNCNWEIFWRFTANLSIGMAYINILPIPSLDGSYMFLTLIKIITENKLMEKTIFIVFTMMTVKYGKFHYL